MTISVVLVDDQQLVRTGMRHMLDAADGITVVGEAANGAEALDVVAAVEPDVVVMDVRMPVMDGITATARLTSRPNGPRVLVVTTFDADEHVYRALAAGASGYLLKDAPEAQLLDAIRIAHDGGALFAPSATRHLVEHFTQAQVLPADAVAHWQLTTRETEVLTLIARGQSNAEIASTLWVSEATAKTHVARILTKTGARSRTHAVVLAYENGIVRPGFAG